MVDEKPDNLDDIKDDVDEELNNDDDYENDNEAGEENEKIEDNDKEFKLPDKFKGKTLEEVAKSYVELEKMIEKKAIEKARELIKKEKEKEKEEFDEEESEENINFSSMTPEEFASWVKKEIDRKVAEKATKIYESKSQIQREAAREIAEAKKEFPLLETNQKFKELVLAVIEAAAAKNKTIKLIDACRQVNEFIGEVKTPGQLEEEKMKRAKAIVEKQGGRGTGEGTDTEEEQIKRRLLESAVNKSVLGGLGI